MEVCEISLTHDIYVLLIGKWLKYVNKNGNQNGLLGWGVVAIPK